MITKKAIVAGRICLDIRPDLSNLPYEQMKARLEDGSLIRSKGVKLSPGGAVVKIGLPLHQLGVPVQLVGKIGDDLFGRSLKAVIRQESPSLVGDLVIDPGTATAYTVIIDSPGGERISIDFNGANDTFYASDLPRAMLKKSDLFHFSDPASMRSIFRGDGAELVSILQRARRAGLTTSVDVSLPDPASPAGRADWEEILANALPWMDIFMADAGALTFMLNRVLNVVINADDNQSFLNAVTPDLLHDLSDFVLGYGVKLILIELGHRGVYLRTGGHNAWQKHGRATTALGEDWHHRELWAPAFCAEARRHSDAGGSFGAGFIAAMLMGSRPETALVMASATGACRLEADDSENCLMTWEGISAQIKKGWDVQPLNLEAAGWRKDEADGLWKND